jgi:hypothetical protein
MKHQTEMPKSIYEDRRDAPQALVDVCLRMMAKNRDARYQSAGEVAATLAKWLQSRGKDVSGDSTLRNDTRPVGPPPRRPLTPPRRKDKTSNDDTASNLNQETLKGKASSPGSLRPPSRPSADSQILLGGSSVRVSGSSIVRHGSSIVRGGGSSVLGGKSGTTKAASKSLQQNDEPLSSLIEEAAQQALHELEAANRAGPNRGGVAARPNPSAMPANYTPSYRSSASGGGLPVWAYALIGVVTLAALIAVAIIAAS